MVELKKATKEELQEALKKVSEEASPETITASKIKEEFGIIDTAEKRVKAIHRIASKYLGDSGTTGAKIMNSTDAEMVKKLVSLRFGQSTEEGGDTV